MQLKTNSLMLRLLILLPLVLITAWVYYSGTTYEEQPLLLVDGKEESSVQLPLIQGFTPSGPARVFLKDNLYEYVNGHAEFFISSGFQSLTVIELDSESGKGEIITEIYDMGSLLNATATLSAEKGSATFTDAAGDAAYASEGTFQMREGQYYIRLAPFNISQNTVLQTAQAIAGSFQSEKEQAIIFILPKENKVENSGTFVSDYMGLPFMKDVETASYLFGEQEAEAFYTADAAAELIKFFEEEGSEITTGTLNGFATYRIQDKYEGTIHLLQDGTRLVGIRGDISETIRNNFMQNAAKRLK